MFGGLGGWLVGWMCGVEEELVLLGRLDDVMTIDGSFSFLAKAM
jgi:hypothetical protein